MRRLNLQLVLFIGVFAVTGCQKAKMSKVPANKPAAPHRVTEGGADGPQPAASPASTPTTRPNLPPSANGRPVNQPNIVGGGQDVILPKPPAVAVVETPVITTSVSTQDAVAPVLQDAQEWRLNRKPILTPPEKRPDTTIPWFDSKQSYKSVLRVCGTPERPCPPPEMVLLPAPPAPPPETPRIVFDQPLIPHTNKLDILFVVDTSDSLDVIVMEIARQVGKFIENLPPHNDYNIGVMLSHSPDSPYASKLYTMDSRDVAVLKSQDIKSVNRIRDALVQKIATVKLHRDRTDGQGELGMLSLQNAVKDPRYSQNLRDSGFLRSDAGLTVIFISDEQDVCFDYSLHPNLKPKYTPNIGRNNEVKRDWFEYQAFNKYCKNPDGSPVVTSESLINALRSAKQDKPVILTGIIFLSEEAIHKKNFQDAYRLEHEVGYGYKETIEKADGQAVELADRNFGEQMAKLGLFSNIRLSFVNKFQIMESPDLVRKSSIEVRLIYPPASKKAPKVIGGNDIKWENPYVIVSDNAIIQGFIPGTKVEVTYKYKN